MALASSFVTFAPAVSYCYIAYFFYFTQASAMEIYNSLPLLDLHILFGCFLGMVNVLILSRIFLNT
jgi:hypothetical protein